MGSRVTSSLLVALLLGALAAGASADPHRSYRWVGQDGHVYETSTPPPNGVNAIESTSSAAKPAASAQTVGAWDAFLGWLHQLWGSFMAWVWGAEKRPAARRGVVAEQTLDCSRWADVISDWRRAQKSVEDAEQRLDQIQSRTDDFIRRDETAYDNSVSQATDAIERARDRVSQLEDQGQHAGMPQSCLTE
jgi:hypothetical protein